MTTLLTPQELADQWQMHVKSIYRLVEQEKLRAVRLPGSRLLRFDPANLKYTEAEIRARNEQRKRNARQVVAQHDERRRKRLARNITHPPLPPRRRPE